MKFVIIQISPESFYVAPARERGLKLMPAQANMMISRRSREGAWIEMTYNQTLDVWHLCRSREGAWIEIPTLSAVSACLLGRSREGAWIEIRLLAHLKTRM